MTSEEVRRFESYTHRQKGKGMSYLDDAKWEVCECCGRRVRQITEATRVCDWCKTEINEDADELEVVVFTHGDKEATHYGCCSWKCVMGVLEGPGSLCDYFITLPYIQGDNNDEHGLKGFLNFMRQYGTTEAV